MFGFGMPQILIILAIALIIFGPQKLPELARTLGKALADFKRAANDFKSSIEEEAQNEEARETALKEAESVKEVLSGDGYTGGAGGEGGLSPFQHSHKKRRIYPPFFVPWTLNSTIL